MTLIPVALEACLWKVKDSRDAVTTVKLGHDETTVTANCCSPAGVGLRRNQRAIAEDEPRYPRICIFVGCRMTRRTVAHLLHLMRHVANETIDPWAREFAKDMAARTRWRTWSPTPKQRASMERLANELFSHFDREVVEGDEG